MTHGRQSDPPGLVHLRKVPFVQEVLFRPAVQRDNVGNDGGLEIQTARGTFHLVVEQKRSHLSLAELQRLIVWLHHVRPPQTDIMLLANHIARPAAEVLIEAKMNFADEAGNMHLRLGDHYNWTVVGLPPMARPPARRSITAAQLQLLVQFLTHPDSVNWPVRQLEPAAGISKSKAAQARQQMAAEGLLTATGNRFSLGPGSTLGRRLATGYAEVLRPQILLGRYRSADKTAEEFLNRLANSDIRYALTGTPAADILHRFYRSPDVTVFIERPAKEVAQPLRLLPDREGNVTLLRAFGEVVYWERRGRHMVAPPWLVYAELLDSDDPRAHEAARQLQQEFLA